MSTNINKYFVLLFCSGILLFFSCKDNKKAVSLFPKIENSNLQPVVTTYKIKAVEFNNEIISNGKLEAVNKADIHFSGSEVIQTIKVKEGYRVEAGEIMAELNTENIEKRLRRLKENLDKSALDLDDRLIDYGYRLKDSAAIPKELLKISKIKSGFTIALYDYLDALKEYGDSKIKAPFSGYVANLEARPFNKADSYKKFCTVIDNSKLYVNFTLMEQELSVVGPGTSLTVEALGATALCQGEISSINPILDNNGMINVKGVVHNPLKLLEGMSVRVIIKQNKSKDNKIVIPRSALLQRQNKWVVFTYEAGKAIWNYVTLEDQNSNFVVIGSGLKMFQEVIISNNANLSNNVDVIVQGG